MCLPLGTPQNHDTSNGTHLHSASSLVFTIDIFSSLYCRGPTSTFITSCKPSSLVAAFFESPATRTLLFNGIDLRHVNTYTEMSSFSLLLKLRNSSLLQDTSKHLPSVCPFSVKNYRGWPRQSEMLQAQNRPATLYSSASSPFCRKISVQTSQRTVHYNCSSLYISVFMRFHHHFPHLSEAGSTVAVLILGKHTPGITFFCSGRNMMSSFPRNITCFGRTSVTSSTCSEP